MIRGERCVEVNREGSRGEMGQSVRHIGSVREPIREVYGPALSGIQSSSSVNEGGIQTRKIEFMTHAGCSEQWLRRPPTPGTPMSWRPPSGSASPIERCRPCVFTCFDPPRNGGRLEVLLSGASQGAMG